MTDSAIISDVGIWLNRARLVGAVYSVPVSYTHLEVALAISRERNLDIIGNSISFLKKTLEEAFFAAEHFFDGFKRDPEYALSLIHI